MLKILQKKCQWLRVLMLIKKHRDTNYHNIRGGWRSSTDSSKGKRCRRSCVQTQTKKKTNITTNYQHLS